VVAVGGGAAAAGVSGLLFGDERDRAAVSTLEMRRVVPSLCLTVVVVIAPLEDSVTVTEAAGGEAADFAADGF